MPDNSTIHGLRQALRPGTAMPVGAALRRTVCRVRRACLCILLLCLSFHATGCGDSSGNREQERALPVRLVRVEKRDVPRVLEAVGNVEAFSSVQVKSQVGGLIVEVPVQAGQEVEAGQLLFRLDPRPFDAAVAEARAGLARNQALLEKARQDLVRYTTLMKQDVISREAFDLVATAEKTIRADIEKDHAAIQTAELNREYSEIRAPVAGKLGDILVRTGNVIKANDERTLVVINSLRPAEVQFTVPERRLPDILELVKKGPLIVEVLPEGDQGSRIPGRVTAVNNEVDRTTGSIRLHALFPNEDNRLWPGQFVRVAVVLATLKDVPVLPEKAVQEGISGPYVYLASPDPEAGEGRYRVTPVSVVSEPGPDDLRVVTSGLAPGDIVVSEGQLGLSPGAAAVDIGARDK
ncbi:MAG: efflux RND transporter periplasmic adaptor subunit [Desulfovibrio sp.]|jgi:multidrug efflux system membrane fusion protein|nr:efflux RND transporter periplasmic adaptor subunit [Desulfovibrio sp.]